LKHGGLLNEVGPQSAYVKVMKIEPAEMDLRSYGIGAQILADLGVHDMTLLSNTHHTLVALQGYGLSVAGQRPIPDGE